MVKEDQRAHAFRTRERMDRLTLETNTAREIMAEEMDKVAELQAEVDHRGNQVAVLQRRVAGLQFQRDGVMGANVQARSTVARFQHKVDQLEEANQRWTNVVALAETVAFHRQEEAAYVRKAYASLLKALPKRSKARFQYDDAFTFMNQANAEATCAEQATMAMKHGGGTP